MMRDFRASVRAAAVPCLMAACLAGAAPDARAAGVRTVTIGTQTVTLEVASTPEEQSRGLMHRTRLAPGHGMLFVFEPPRQIAMWMKDTLIDLDAGFFDACGTLFNVRTMKRRTLDLHHSMGPAASVVEMPAGWFVRHGVVLGTTVAEFANPDWCRKP